jgi:hypothetical protein
MYILLRYSLSSIIEIKLKSSTIKMTQYMTSKPTLCCSDTHDEYDADQNGIYPLDVVLSG